MKNIFKRISSIIVATTFCTVMFLIPAYAVTSLPIGAISSNTSIYNQQAELNYDGDHNGFSITVSDSYTYTNGVFYPVNPQSVYIADAVDTSVGTHSFPTACSGKYIWGPEYGTWWFYGATGTLRYYGWNDDTNKRLYSSLFKIGDSFYLSKSSDAYQNWTTITISLTMYYVPVNVRYVCSGQLPPTISANYKTIPHRSGENVGVESNLTIAGYDFSGWNTADVTVNSGTFTVPSTDVTFTGIWTAHTNTQYRVEFYKED